MIRLVLVLKVIFIFTCPAVCQSQLDVSRIQYLVASTASGSVRRWWVYRMLTHINFVVTVTSHSSPGILCKKYEFTTPPTSIEYLLKYLVKHLIQYFIEYLIKYLLTYLIKYLLTYLIPFVTTYFK